MRRKTIQLAKKTLVISLPSKWVKAYAIKKGDELEIETKHDSLFISLHKQQPKTSKRILAEDWGKILSRHLVGLYHKGINEFEIQFASAQHLQGIQTAVSHMIGFEIVQQEKNKVILKDVTGPSDEDFMTVFRRLFLIVLQMFEEGIAAVKKNNKEDIKTVVLKDIEVNKFSHFCLRKINKGDVEDEYKARIYHTICVLLEKTADELKRNLQDKKRIKELEGLEKLLRSCYELTMNPLSKKALAIAHQYDQTKISSELTPLRELIILIQNQQLGLIE